MESIQADGLFALNREFAEKIIELCEKNDILLLVDEVLTGLGRTGHFLSSSYYNFIPDGISLGGGLGGGLPIGAALMGEKLKGVLKEGDFSSVLGGNDLAVAGAGAVLQMINGKLSGYCFLAEEICSRIILKPCHR